MESTKMDKMIKLARFLNKVFRVFRKIIIIFAIFIVLLLIILTVIQTESTDGNLFNTSNSTTFVDLGPITVKFVQGYSLDLSNTLTFAWFMAVIWVPTIGVIYYALGLIQKILTPMAEGSPFYPSIGVYIRKLSFACLALGIMQNIMQFLEVLFAIYVYDLYESIWNTQVASVTANFTFDIGFIVVFFILLLLSYVFSYGEELQKLSDETL